ncbi:DDE superfamily endonuclease [Halolamina pelagica]|uniref:DDE superfamily endonuclease n=1 Tax=Halolamina pelagica TaxID=699431 RepID=A0A1I5UJJ3_9EURY|nr:DDE superfamily endonuclease [Halolamina pelagica]
MPITNFLSSTRVFDEFDSMSPAQRRHAKTYATGLVAASNKTVAGIAREVLPANSKRAINKFLTEYDGDEQQFNHELLEELQKHGETRWLTDGYIILDDTITQKTGNEVPGVGRFYHHAEDDIV